MNKDMTTPEEIFEERSRQAARPVQASGMSSVAIGLMVVGIALLTGVGGFIGGLQVGKSSSTTVASSMGGQGQMGGQRGMGAMGTVTAVSSSSITVKDSMQNTDVTFNIGSSTTVTDNGSSSSLSAVKVGDKVFVRTATSSTNSSSTSSVASVIELNPTMPTGGQGGPSSTSSSTSTN